ncbi:MAG: hypothetical protein H6839_11640 [Planctomycetes bacterium]|nr:hypothetical protein [Planctomycetota bacterium]
MLTGGSKYVWCRRGFLLAYSLLLTFGMTWPQWSPWWYHHHEREAYITRFDALIVGLSEQHWHPRWIPDLAAGHGYPLFNYYTPGFSYLALPFAPLGELAAVKILLVLSTLMMFFAAYALGKSQSNWRGGLLMATLCITAPYMMYNLHIRGDLSEYVAFAFAILALHLMLRAMKRPTAAGPWLAFAAVYSTIVCIHTLSGLMYTVLFGSFALLLAYHRRWKPRDYARLAMAFGIGLVLSTWYWLPALGEKSLVSTERMLEGFVNIEKRMGYFPVNYTWLSVRLPVLGAILTGVLVAVSFSIATSARRKFIVTVCVVYAVIGTVLMYDFALPFWTNVPFGRYFQFSWRTIAPTTLFIALGAAAVLRRRESRWISAGVLALSGAIACASVIWLANALSDLAWKHVTEDEISVEGRFNEWDTVGGVDEYLPATAVREKVELPPRPLVTAGEGATVSQATRDSLTITAQVDSPQGTNAIIRQWDFPGWEVAVDGAPAAHGMDDAGRILVAVPPGKHDLRAELHRTPIEVAAEVISGIAWALLTVAAIVLRVRKKHPAKLAS